MAKIITLAHQKGGVGKSTLALNLALCFKDQLRVALIDSDLQGSIYHLKEDFPELNILVDSAAGYPGTANHSVGGFFQHHAAWKG